MDPSTYAERLATFKRWPHKTPAAADIAEAGFIKEWPLSSCDMVYCLGYSPYSNCWEPDDDPLIEHFSRPPNCEIAKRQKRKEQWVKQRAERRTLKILVYVLFSLFSPWTEGYSSSGCEP